MVLPWFHKPLSPDGDQREMTEVIKLRIQVGRGDKTVEERDQKDRGQK